MDKVFFYKNKAINFIKENKLFFLLFLFSFLIFSLWLLAHFPGNMSPDSVNQWLQVINFRLQNDHPYVHTLIIYLLRLIWDSPAIVVLFQILLSSFLVSYFTYLLLKNGASRFWSYFAYFFFVFSIPIGHYNTILWKDVLFAQLILLVSIVFVRHYLLYQKSKKQSLSPKILSLLIFAFLIVLTSLIRHNGIIYLFFIPLLYYLLKIFTPKKIIILFLISLAIFGFFRIILFNVLDVSTKDIILLKETPKIQIIGAIISQKNFQISPQQKEVLANVLPIEFWNKNYNCTSVNYLIFMNPRPNIIKLQSKEFAQTWNKTFWELAKKNPGAILKDRACLFYALTFNTRLAYYNNIHQDPKNDFTMQQKPISQTLNKFFNNLLEKSLNYYFISLFNQGNFIYVKFLIWGLAIPIIFFIAFWIWSLFAKNWLIFGYASIVLVNIPIIFLIGVASDYRYLFMVAYSFPFLFPLISLKNAKKF